MLNACNNVECFLPHWGGEFPWVYSDCRELAMAVALSADEKTPNEQEKQMLEMANHLQDYLNEGDSLKILVAGKMGVGKTSLINSIYGAEIAVEDNSAAAVTDEIINYTASVPTPYEKNEGKESTITIWDSPGFGDVFATNKDKIIEELKYVVDKAHILVYCFDVRGRLTRDDVDGIIEITKQVSPDIWRNAVFTLNFCNELRPPQEDMDPIEFFAKSYRSWQKEITRALRELAKVPDRIANNISITACGYRDKQPPGYRNWYTTFWSTVYEKMRDDGQPLLLKLTLERCIDNSVPDVSEAEPQSPQTSVQRKMNPHALKVQLFGERDRPGLITGAVVLNGRHSSGAQTHHVQTSAPKRSVPPATVDDVTVQIDDLLQPRCFSGSDSTRKDSSPASSAQHVVTNLPPPAVGNPPRSVVGNPPRPAVGKPPQPPEEPPMPRSSKKAFLKGAGGVAGAAAAGAVVGALVGILGGPIGVGVGTAGGAVVGTTIGVIALIAMKLGQYIKKKKKAALHLAQETVTDA